MTDGSSSGSSGNEPGRAIDRRLLLRGALAAGGLAALALPARRLLRADDDDAAKPVAVGGLAVTCNLTLPIACAANEAANPFGTSDAAQQQAPVDRAAGLVTRRT